MFIRHDGYIFPCCRVWCNEKFKIGHISENNIIEKIYKYNIECSCTGYIFNNKNISNNIGINIEFPMTCNGKCAMCCVHAPFKQKHNNKYDYNALDKIVYRLKPSTIAVQGGEVLVQPQTIEWISKIKKDNNDISFHIVSNGCISTKMAKLCSLLFTSMTISIVGFQDHTYNAIMGLDISKTKNFVAKMMDMRSTKISLKYLCTPLNIHEIHLFLKWAIECSPESIQIVDADFKSYINLNTSIPFWDQIIQRCSKLFIHSLHTHKELLNKNNTDVWIDEKIMKTFSTSYEDLKNFGINTVKQYY
jgi:pyruvate-formate lyase-activating enzyme